MSIMEDIHIEDRPITEDRPTFIPDIINDGDTVTLVLRNGEVRTGKATITRLRNVTAVCIDNGITAIINHIENYTPDPYDVMEIQHTPYGAYGDYVFRRDNAGEIGVYQNYVCVASFSADFTSEDAWNKMEKANRYIKQCQNSKDISCQQSVLYHRSVMKCTMYTAMIHWFSRSDIHSP